MFVAFTDLGIKHYKYPTGAEKVTQRFLPHELMNRDRQLFRVKYTQLIDDFPNVIHYFRRNMSYEFALECASKMADALGLKQGLPVGFMWLTVTPMEIEETITIEEDCAKVTEDDEE